jgi:hypothetical protein
VGSSSRQRTTIAKLNRERRLRERRQEKQARTAARKLAARREAESASGDALAEQERPEPGAEPGI